MSNEFSLKAHFSCNSHRFCELSAHGAGCRWGRFRPRGRRRRSGECEFDDSGPVEWYGDFDDNAILISTFGVGTYADIEVIDDDVSPTDDAVSFWVVGNAVSTNNKAVKIEDLRTGESAFKTLQTAIPTLTFTSDAPGTNNILYGTGTESSMDAVVVKVSVGQRPVVNAVVYSLTSVANAQQGDFGAFGIWDAAIGGYVSGGNWRQTDLNGETTWRIGANALPGGLRNARVLFELDGATARQPNGLDINAGDDPSLIYDVNWHHYEQP